MVAVFHILNALLMLLIPLFLGVFIFRKLGAPWRIFGIGMLTFILSQIFHIPFNAKVLNAVMENLGMDADIPLGLLGISVLAGLSAGVFEEVSCYLGYRFWLKGPADRTWSSALMFGAGHGGVESIILGLLALYAFFQIFALQHGGLDDLPAAQMEIARAQVTAYWAVPWYAALLGALERVSALSIHLSATVIVLQVFRRKRSRWLLLAILWHAVVDASAVFVGKTWGIYAAEALVAIFGLTGLAIIFLLRETTTKPEPDAPSFGERESPETEKKLPSLENLENSRYV